MEGSIMLVRFFVRTMSVVVNWIKSCCNTFHGHIFTVFAGTCLKVHYRGFWMLVVIGWGRLHFDVTLRRCVGRSSKLPGFVRWAISRPITCWCWTRMSAGIHPLNAVHSMAVWKMSSRCGISILLLQSSLGGANIRGFL